MLKSLEIQNFKGIRQGKLDDLAQVNILVGRNNSGKSTILDALILFRRGLVDRDYSGAEGFDQIVNRRVKRGSLNHDELWFRMDTSTLLKLSAKFDSGADVRQEWSKPLTVRFESGEWTRALNSDRMTSVRDFRNTGRIWGELSQHAGEENGAFMGLIHLLDANSIHYPFAEHIWHELVKDRLDTKVVRILNDIYRTDIEFLSFMPHPRETRLVAALPNTGVAIDWLGDGFRYALNILALGVFLKGTALLVEELETHQHPESLRKLTQTLFALAKEQDLQLFLTTHSMELITYALDAAEERGIDLKLHHLTLDQEGTLKSIPFTQPNAQLLLDMGHDPRMHYKYIKAE